MSGRDDDDRGRNDRDDDRGRARSRSRSRSPAGRGAPAGQLSGVACRWSDKGFGFIKPDDGGEDLFCHVSAIRDGNCLSEGARVTFDRNMDSSKGKDRADNVYGGFQEEERSFGGRGGGGNREGGFHGEPRAGKETGIACRWSEKGFGFIKPDDGGEDLFCHFSQIKDGRAYCLAIYPSGKPRVPPSRSVCRRSNPPDPA